jgi:hypothetical protein
MPEQAIAIAVPVEKEDTPEYVAFINELAEQEETLSLYEQGVGYAA